MVGQKMQLVDHHTGSTEVMDLNRIEFWFFFRLTLELPVPKLFLDYKFYSLICCSFPKNKF